MRGFGAIVLALAATLGLWWLLPSDGNHERELSAVEVEPTVWVDETNQTLDVRRKTLGTTTNRPLPSNVSRLASKNEQLVQFTQPTTVEDVAEKLGTQSTNVEQLTDDIFVVREPTVDPATVDSVASADRNAVFRALARPNDASFGNQQGLSNVSATDAWDLETGHHTVRIAIVDTGVNGLHEDLRGKVIEGYDFVNDRAISRNSDSDDNGHGTAVTSVAAAYGNNSVGIAGMAWNIEIMPVKVLNSFGFGYTREVVLGTKYAIDHGADIIVMSIGSTEKADLLEEAINDGWNKKILTIAAAGNEGPADLAYPARYDHVLSVGATNGNDVRASFSNVGLSLDLVAPGVDITHATDSDTGYDRSNGTSFAAPFVAGTAALLKSRHPGLSAEQLFNAIRDTTDKVAGMSGAGRSDFYGYGRLNAVKALRSVAGSYAGEHVAHTENIPALGSTQSWNVEFQYRNTGSSVWKNTGPYRMELATAKPDNHLMPFSREDLVTRQPSGWLTDNRIQMVESEVRPGGIGTFRFWISVPSGMTGQTYTESVQLNVRDVGAVANTTSSFDVKVLAEVDRYHAQYVGQTANPTISPLASAKFQVHYKNVGNATWTRDIVQLGTSHEQDRVSRFQREDTTNRNASGWTSATRIKLDQSRVAPGEIGSFTFYLADTTDIAPGTYREFFQPVAKDITWLEDHGIFWDITVQ